LCRTAELALALALEADVEAGLARVEGLTTTVEVVDNAEEGRVVKPDDVGVIVSAGWVERDVVISGALDEEEEVTSTAEVLLGVITTTDVVEMDVVGGGVVVVCCCSVLLEEELSAPDPDAD